MKFECYSWVLRILVEHTNERNALGKKLRKVLTKHEDNKNSKWYLTVNLNREEAHRIAGLISGMKAVLNNHNLRLEEAIEIFQQQRIAKRRRNTAQTKFT